MTKGQNVFLIRVRKDFLEYEEAQRFSYEKGVKRLSKLPLEGAGLNVFLKYVLSAYVFLKYGLGAEHLSEIWLRCETFFWKMVRVSTGTSFLCIGRGKTSFLSMR